MIPLRKWLLGRRSCDSAYQKRLSKETFQKLARKISKRLRLALISPLQFARKSRTCRPHDDERKMQILFDFRLAYLTHTENSCVGFTRESRINCVYIFIAHHRLSSILSPTDVCSCSCLYSTVGPATRQDSVNSDDSHRMIHWIIAGVLISKSGL